MKSDFDKSIYQLKDGCWGFRFCVRIDGKNVYKRVSKNKDGKPFYTKKEVLRARAAAIEKEQSSEALPRPTKHVRRTVTQVFEEFCEKGRADRAFMMKRKQDSLWENHIKEKFGKRYIPAI